MNTEVDILIVGAGASGAAAAWNLSTLNLNILCLEQGDYTKPENYPSTKVNWESYKYNEYNWGDAGSGKIYSYGDKKNL